MSAGDVRPQPLSGLRHFAAHHLTTKCERRLAIEDIENVGLLIVHLNLSGGLAVAARDEQIRPGDEAAAFRERRRHFFGIDMDDARVLALSARDDANREQPR